MATEYNLIPGFAKVKIDQENKLYTIAEPTLSPKDIVNIEKIKEALVEITDIDLASITDPEKAKTTLEKEIVDISEEVGISISGETFHNYLYYIFRDFLGLSIIEPIMRDPLIEDISCDGLNIPIFITHRDFGSLKTNLLFNDEDELNSFIVMLSQRCNRYISFAEPLLDGTLPNGARVQATYGKDVTTRGSTFSIRKFRQLPLTPKDLIESNMLNPQILAYIWLAIENRASILICGGTATGKTTLLNTISLFIPPELKIVSIEDTRELNIPHINWIPATSRTGFGTPTEAGSRYGEVTMFDLLKESFRERPDYVIVGEVRGEEAYVLFQGMSSGHASLGTMHADSVESVIRRLTSPPINLSSEHINALDLIIVLTNIKLRGKWERRIKEIEEIRGVDEKSDEPIIEEIVKWSPVTDSFSMANSSYLIQRIATMHGTSEDIIRKELERREDVIKRIIKKGIRDIREFSRLLNIYMRDPNDFESVMK